MKKIFLSALLSIIPYVQSASTPDTESETESKQEIEPKREIDKSDKSATAIDQKQLFNMMRRGVVAISVTAQITTERTYNDKAWCGTGFIVDIDKGLIVTNAHVAGELAVCTYEVKFGNGRTAEARLEYLDPCYDFAILSVDKKNIPNSCIALKCSERPIAINSTVYSMGNSARNEFSTYQGYVFDTESTLWLKPIAEQSFQFSGLTVPGASGSPVFNENGEVIGVLYGGKFVSGAALPISYVTPVIEDIKSNRRSSRYILGCIMDYTNIQEAAEAGIVPAEAVKEYNNRFQDSNNKVLVIRRKLGAYGADKAQLEAGDIIWRVDGQLIGASLKAIDATIQRKAGKSVALEVYRRGKKLSFEAPVHKLSVAPKMRLLSFAGATFFEIIDEIKIVAGITNNGVFITDSEPGSPFHKLTSPTQGYCCVNGERCSIQVTGIEGRKIASLDDITAIIPELFTKEVFSVNYMQIMQDKQEMSSTVKHVPEFAQATMYAFDAKAKKWNVEQIKAAGNPQENLRQR